MAAFRLFTSESVSEGHPDKIADQISDAVLDALLAQDPEARVACETLVKTGLVMLAGEITTNTWVDTEAIVRKTLHDIGYRDPDYGFDGASCAVLSAIGKQSPDIAQAVLADQQNILGAGDQGLMFGFACDETPEFMPATLVYAHRLLQKLSQLRHHGILPWLRPDAKSQVTLEYAAGFVPVAVDKIVLSTQHDPRIHFNELQEALLEEVIKQVFPAAWLHQNTQYLINPSGRFVIGGPQGDCGLTGRKIIVDTYGGWARHGGGCFSGKDPTKVDRSAAYAARYIAKHLVASGLCRRCEVQLSYAIGCAEPTSLQVDTFNTAIMDEAELISLIRQHFPLKPHDIIQSLQLAQPIYRPTATYGHFGRHDLDLPWERLDKLGYLK